MIANEYKATVLAARTTLKAGFALAVNVAILCEANASLPRPSDNAVFLRNRQWNMDALHAYRAPEPVTRAYFGDTLGADMKKATASRGFTNGRQLATRHSALVAEACAIPAGRNEPWAVADKVKALTLALAAEGVRCEADLVRYCEAPSAEKAPKTPLELATAALTLSLKHGKELPEFLTLAASAIAALQSGNVERAAELLAAAGQVQPQETEEAERERMAA